MNNIADLEKKINSELASKIKLSHIKHNQLYLDIKCDDLITVLLFLIRGGGAFLSSGAKGITLSGPDGASISYFGGAPMVMDLWNGGGGTILSFIFFCNNF